MSTKLQKMHVIKLDGAIKLFKVVLPHGCSPVSIKINDTYIHACIYVHELEYTHRYIIVNLRK